MGLFSPFVAFFWWLLSWLEWFNNVLKGELVARNAPSFRDFSHPVFLAVSAVLIVWHWQVRYRVDDDLLAFSPETFLRGDWYRALTAPLTHGNVTHLICNIAALGPLCWTVEIGSSWHILGTLCAIWLIKTALYSMIRFNSRQLSYGFSGEVFGLMAFEAGLQYTKGLGFKHLISPFWMMVVISVKVPNASFAGHFTGAVAGLLVFFFHSDLLIQGSSVVLAVFSVVSIIKGKQLMPPQRHLLDL